MITKLKTKGFYLNYKGEIEEVKYKDYLHEFGSDETTTPNGVAPRLFLKGKKVMSWGVRGNNLKEYAVLESKKDAKKTLYQCWANNVEEECNVPQFYLTKDDLYEDLSQHHDTTKEVIERYFNILFSEAN